MKCVVKNIRFPKAIMMVNCWDRFSNRKDLYTCDFRGLDVDEKRDIYLWTTFNWLRIEYGNMTIKISTLWGITPYMLLKFDRVSEEYVASTIFRVLVLTLGQLNPVHKCRIWGSNSDGYEAAASTAVIGTCFFPVSSLAYSFTLKMEVSYSSETSVDFQRTIRHCIPEDRTLHNHRY
jgi:hypothetical protein